MRIGTIGAGQLARMLALAGIPLGHDFVFLAADRTSCAARLGRLICAEPDSGSLRDLAASVDVVTFEWENIPVEVLDCLESADVAVRPAPKAVRLAQDRLFEKQLFEKIGVPVAPFRPVECLDDLLDAVDAIGVPSILKTRREGYDGKGQILIREAGDASAAWEALGGRACVLEQVVPFAREVSVIAVRALDGRTACYPLSENTHREGILHTAVSRPGDPRFDEAASVARDLMAELDYVGVLVIEFFEHEGVLIANEFAPRVHNSGHWTIEGAVSSQFENHIRAIAGHPLGSTEPTCFAAMVNLIGTVPPIDEMLALPGVHVHVYGKTERPKRKEGHVTVCAATEARRDELLASAVAWAP